MPRSTSNAILRPSGGYFVWLDLPHGADAAELLPRATAAGVTFVPGADFYPRGEGGAGAARLAFSFVSPAEIDEGVSRLAELLPDVPAAGTAARAARRRGSRSRAAG